MLDVDVRKTIFELHRRGHGFRTIARMLGITRKTVKAVVKQGVVEHPGIERDTPLDPHIERLRELYAECKGNRVRVWEKMEEEKGTKTAYSTLTGFCRRHAIGVKPKEPAGRYTFEPGEEMQKDTSPHGVQVGGRMQKLQCAGLVMCFSTMCFAQVYSRFTRFWCKVFLTDAGKYFDAMAKTCMIDNTHVVIAYGTGRNAVVAPEMHSFADRFGFRFTAHEKGHANRSAHVERLFHYIENNFYPGRTFRDLEDLNKQLIEWCDKVNRTFKKSIQARPIDLFQTEKPALTPLPPHVPEVYNLEQRIVDIEGYAALHANRYSAPADLIGRTVQVRESKDRVRILHDDKVVCEHPRLEDGARTRSTLPEHQRRGLWRDKRCGPLRVLPEESLLKNAGDPFDPFIEKLKTQSNKRHAAAIRKLHRMFLDYPTPLLRNALQKALEFGLIDLERIERMVLRSVAHEFFRLPEANENPDEEDNHG